MNNCIFTAHCMESICDRSCPILVETSYLLERNGLSFKNPVFQKYGEIIPDISNMIDENEGQVIAFDAERSARNCRLDTVQAADLITYCAICKYWKGSQLHCTVYNLRFSRYLEETKKSWNTKGENENSEMMRIWAESAKFLVISNFDYVKFGDFESQTMLNLIQLRQSQGLTTLLTVKGDNGGHYIYHSQNASSFAGVLDNMIRGSLIKLKSGNSGGNI